MIASKQKRRKKQAQKLRDQGEKININPEPDEHVEEAFSLNATADAIGHEINYLHLRQDNADHRSWHFSSWITTLCGKLLKDGREKRNEVQAQHIQKARYLYGEPRMFHRIKSMNFGFKL